jgi:hypothetical protein
MKPAARSPSAPRSNSRTCFFPGEITMTSPLPPTSAPIAISARPSPSTSSRPARPLTPRAPTA